MSLPLERVQVICLPLKISFQLQSLRLLKIRLFLGAVHYPLTQPPLSIKFDTKYKALLYSMVLPFGTDSRLSGHHQQALSTPIYAATCDCNMYSHLGTANVHSMRQITMHHRGTFSVGNRHVHTCGRLWAVRMCTVYMPDARRGRPRSWEGRSEAPPATPDKYAHGTKSQRIAKARDSA